MRNIIIPILLLIPIFTFSEEIVINEIMSSNHITIDDEDGESSDWIELYNCGSEEVNLTGCYLSDDSLETKKWQFGEATIEAGEHLLIFASDKDKFDQYWHTNFKISAGGESVLLSDSNGAIIDQVWVPASESDVSYGRRNDGADSWIFQESTPGSTNTGEEILEYSDSVHVSLPGGFYSSAVSVELNPNSCDIYYTLDGSEPDSTSPKYSEPINITETTVLKAISKKENHQVSPTTYQTYFIGTESDLPVVSLISDPKNLFDDNYGIYANGPGWTPNPPHHGANFWKDWERPAHVQFFDDNKNLGFSENCCIEIYGGYTRGFPQKSFSIKFKDPYNSSSLEYPLFPDFDLTTFKAFILRNSGNDFYYTHIRDAMMQSLIRDLDIDYLEYRPAATYINGEYWGIYNIREKINEHYIANRHGVDPDNIDMLEGNMEVIHGDTLHYGNFIDYISNNDMSTNEAYEFVDDMIDIDNCLLYYAAEVYYNSQDWPANNIKYWRERSEDGKWHWIIYDLDFGFNLYESNGQSEDHVYYLFSGVETRPGSNPPWSTLVPRKLVENPKIKQQYINQVADLLNTNFESERVVNKINVMAEHIATEAKNHRERWGINQFTVNSHLQKMRTFAEERPDYLRGFIKDFFECGNKAKITVYSTEGGEIELNTLTLETNDFPWSGIYFSENPVQVRAIPNPGYQFDGWDGADTSSTKSISLSLSRTTKLYASFSPDSNKGNDIVINEINYNSPDDYDSGDWIELYNKSDQSVNIGGWYFSDSDDEHKYFFASEQIINAKDYLVVVEDEDAFTEYLPEVSNYVGETDFGLSGSGEFMKLVNQNEQIIDSLTYDDKTPWPEEADGDGSTLELVNANSDNSLAESWRASSGAGTPGSRNSVATSITNATDLAPKKFVLSNNYPNPFNPTTNIKYSVPEKSYISLTVYDILGNKVATLYEGERRAGNYIATFDGSQLSSGIYISILKSGSFAQSQKMILLK